MNSVLTCCHDGVAVDALRSFFLTPDAHAQEKRRASQPAGLRRHHRQVTRRLLRTGHGDECIDDAQRRRPCPVKIAASRPARWTCPCIGFASRCCRGGPAAGARMALDPNVEYAVRTR